MSETERLDFPTWPATCFECDGAGCDFCVCSKCEVSIWPRCSHPDPCIGYLPGVYNACCGHGKDDEAYITFGLPEGNDNYASGTVALEIITAMRSALGDLSYEKWHGGHD